MTSDDERWAELAAMRHPRRTDRRFAVPAGLVRDIDRILLDHGVDRPSADIKAALAWLMGGS